MVSSTRLISERLRVRSPLSLPYFKEREKKVLNIYLCVVALAFIFAGCFGFVPGLISAASNELVFIGVVILIFTIPLTYILCKNIFLQIKKKVG